VKAILGYATQFNIFHKIIFAIGLIAVSIFTYYHLIICQKHCGVVRGYEYLMGIIGMTAWILGNIIGFILIIKFEGLPHTLGTLILTITNLLIITATSWLFYLFIEDSFILTTTQTIIERVEKNDDRLAILELGKRNVKTSIPLLCKIALNQNKDINLRLNAISALEGIVEISSTSDKEEKSINSCLSQLSKDQEEYMRNAATDLIKNIIQNKQVKEKID